MNSEDDDYFTTTPEEARDLKRKNEDDVNEPNKKQKTTEKLMNKEQTPYEALFSFDLFLIFFILFFSFVPRDEDFDPTELPYFPQDDDFILPTESSEPLPNSEEEICSILETLPPFPIPQGFVHYLIFLFLFCF